ncbi:MAG TPA: HD domain-containing phosphohydrolase [Ignavibacteriales bacterium]|nr:HD domain-containing phosphohydrolase [Ignavibacteriales bacterium]
MNNKILFVDDEKNILEAYQRILYKRYKILTADNGEQALAYIKKNGPFAVIVSDYRMPNMNGNQFLEAAKKIAPDSVRVMLTGQADLSATVEAINKGSIFRFIEKPCPTDQLVSILDAAIEQHRLITAEKELLENTLRGSIKVLIDILSIVNPNGFSISSKLKEITFRIARHMNITDTWELELTSALSQIGCVAVPPEILYKKYTGEPLDDKEEKLFLSHPQIGKNLLANIPRLENISESIYYQMHKFKAEDKLPGSLTGEDIPLYARILKVAIDYDMHIRSGKQSTEAVEEMRSRTNWYDPAVLVALESEYLFTDQVRRIRSIKVKEIVTGMILAEDVKTDKGALLMRKGFEITEVLKARLLSYAQYHSVAEPIKIIEFGKNS